MVSFFKKWGRARVTPNAKNTLIVPPTLEIHLIDNDDNPVAGEPYRVTTAKGRVIKGNLDADGKADIRLPQPGECKVSFPKLDGALWELTDAPTESTEDDTDGP
jgi:uncharacterized protein (DUF2345 family)